MKKPNPSKAAKTRARRRVLRDAAAILIDQYASLRHGIEDVMDEDEVGSYRLWQATAARLTHVAKGSREVRAAKAAEAALMLIPAAKHEAALWKAWRSAKDPLLAGGFEPKSVSPEALAHAAVDLIQADRLRRIDAEGLKRVRKFHLRLRDTAAALILDSRGGLVPHRAELLASVPLLLLAGKAVAKARVGVRLRDVLAAADLPRASRRVLPGSVGTISRYNRETFKRWTAKPTVLGQLAHKTRDQRRQIELVSALTAALGNRRLRGTSLHECVAWAMATAPDIPAGRHGRRYHNLVDWIYASTAPNVWIVAPARPWSPRMGAAASVEAAASFASLIEEAAKRVPANLLAELGLSGKAGRAVPKDWPANADIEGISFLYLKTMEEIAAVGSALQNCLAREGGPYRTAIAHGEVAVFAIIEKDAVIGAAALRRDYDGRPAIAEARGPANRALTHRVETILRKWVRG